MKRAESIRISRGRVLAMVGLSAGATLLARRPLLADDEVRPLDAPTAELGSGTSFGPLEQIEAGVLSVGYAEAGPIDGRAAILLHGWPYDIHTYVDVAPLLAAEGCRVVVPYLRGYGTTRFLSGETARNGRQSVIAVDTVASMGAAKIEKAVIGGCDRGARTGNIMAALWPERCEALVSVSGYPIGSRGVGSAGTRRGEPAHHPCRRGRCGRKGSGGSSLPRLPPGGTGCPSPGMWRAW